MFDYKKIRDEIENQGFSGPYKIFSNSDLEIIKKKIYNLSKTFFKDEKSIPLSENLTTKNIKKFNGNYASFVKSRIRKEIFKFGVQKKIIKIITNILEAKNPEFSDEFFDLRFNINENLYDKYSNKNNSKSTGITAWHQDAETLYLNKYKAFNFDIVTVWISLNSADVNNSMEILPKSNKANRLYQQHYHDFREISEVSEDFANSKSYKIKCKAGDVFFLHPLVFHRSIMNTSNHLRCSLDLRYFNPDKKKQNYKIDTLLRYNKMVHNFKETKIFHLLIDSYLKIKSLTSKKRQY